jgi:EIN3-binding F-box protein
LTEEETAERYFSNRAELCYAQDANSCSLFTRLVSSFPTLEDLDLFCCPYITSQGLVAIADSCPKLRSVTIQHVPTLSEESLRYLIEKGEGRIRQLDIDGELMEDETMGMLGKLASSLQKLSIFGVAQELGPVAWEAICRLENLQQLELIGIHRIHQRPADKRQTLPELPQLKQLVSLKVERGCHLRDKDLLALCSLCPNLEDLSLICCHKITDDGLTNLFKTCKLKCLDTLIIIGKNSR